MRCQKASSILPGSSLVPSIIIFFNLIGVRSFLRFLQKKRPSKSIIRSEVASGEKKSLTIQNNFKDNDRRFTGGWWSPMVCIRLRTYTHKRQCLVEDASVFDQYPLLVLQPNQSESNGVDYRGGIRSFFGWSPKVPDH